MIFFPRALDAVALALATLVLAACTSVPPAPSQGWSGKLGYRIEAHEGQRAQAGTAQFELQGNAQQGQLLLSTPLGTSIAQAQWDIHGARLHDGQSWRPFSSLETLGQGLGEAMQGPPLPLHAVFDWLQGRPWSQAPHEVHATGFWQLGWQVEQPEPQRLVVSRPAQGHIGAMQLRFVLTAAAR